MDSELSFTSLVLLVLGIQVCLLIIGALFWLFRSPGRSSKPQSHIKTLLRGNSRVASIISGSVIGMALVATLIYFLIPSHESSMDKAGVPASRPFSETRSPEPYEKEDTIAPSTADRSGPAWKRKTRVGDSRIREVTRKAMRGELPGFSEGKHLPNPALHSYLSLVKTWLEQDKDRAGSEIYTASVYDRLVKDYGYKGSQSTVGRYIKESGEMPLLVPLCGKKAEVNWGPVKAVLNGEQVTLYLFSMRSKWSGKFFVYCCADAQLDTFIDAHIRAFEFFGGIFPTLIYDNLPEPIEKVVRGKREKDQEEFARFCAYYNFTHRFDTNVKDQEKGDVRGSPRAILHKFMVPGSEAENLEELNRNLLEECLSNGDYRMKDRTKTVNMLFDEEKICLLAFPKAQSIDIKLSDEK